VIGTAKGRGILGAVLGLCLGIIGVVIIACLSPKPGYGRPRYHRSSYQRSRYKRPPARPPSTGWPSTLTSKQWAPDPHRRHQMRWWNGAAWTDEVSDGGVLFQDPLGAAPAPPAAPVPGWYQPGPGPGR
jgi:hypothetical protein